MRQIFVTLALPVIMSMATFSCVQAQETGFTETERELHYVAKLWPGDYDNQEQVSFDARAKDESLSDQARFHAVFSTLNLPTLGKFVLYSEEHRDADPNDIHQQYVYLLSADENQKAVRVTPYRFKNPNKYNHPYGYVKTALKISKRDLERLEGCDYLLRRDSESFVGIMENETCDDGVGKGLLQREIFISKDQYAFKERRLDSDGQPINDSTKRNMKRARWFACMIDVPKETQNRSNHTQHYIKLHDQGGEFNFSHPDGRNMKLIMRNTWSYGMQRETFFIGIFEDKTPLNLLVYSWGMPGADRIGMNPGYVRIQCDLDTPENVRLQKRLRSES